MTRLFTICALVLSLSSPAWANLVDVDYTVSGQPGDWTLDFALTNNVAGPADWTLYKFGVALPESNIISQPLAWHEIAPVSINGTTYNEAWQFDMTGLWHSVIVLFPHMTLD